MKISNKIALVEDNLDDAELTKLALESQNICNKLLYFNSGGEAIKYFTNLESENMDLPFLVLLDLKMPLIGGYDVLFMLKNKMETKDIPVVIITSSLENEDMIKCKQYGASGFLQKPVSGKSLLDVIQELGLTTYLTN